MKIEVKKNQFSSSTQVYDKLKNSGMYVQEINGEICFRMWNSEDRKLWEEHDWVPYGAIKKATDIYEGQTVDPKQAYDIEIANALLKEEKSVQRNS